MAAKEERIEKQAAEIAQLRRTVTANDRRIEEQSSRTALLEHDLAGMRDSRSWRLAAPLRHLRGWLNHTKP
jgi:uncharacterized protein HemX